MGQGAAQGSHPTPAASGAGPGDGAALVGSCEDEARSLAQASPLVGATVDTAVLGRQATSPAPRVLQGREDSTARDSLAAHDSPAVPDGHSESDRPAGSVCPAEHDRPLAPASRSPARLTPKATEGARGTTVVHTPEPAPLAACLTPGPGSGPSVGTPALAGFHLAAELAAMASSVGRGSSAHSGSTPGSAAPFSTISPPTGRWGSGTGPSPPERITVGAAAAATPASAAWDLRRPVLESGASPAPGGRTSGDLGAARQRGESEAPPPTPTLQFTAEVARMLQASVAPALEGRGRDLSRVHAGLRA